MPSQTIQWFPGHMARTRRLITENLKNVDVVIELLDARIPYSSKNPEISRICAGKPSIILLNKATLADPSVTAQWKTRLTNEHTVCIETDCVSGLGLNQIAPTIRKLCSEKLDRYEAKGMVGRPLKAMVVGIPNVGKSSLINRLCGNKKTRVENRPGVTLDKQWVATNIGVLLLDMPGVLWPKFEDERVGENLALTGAIRDRILDTEELAMILCGRLCEVARPAFLERYKLTEDDIEGLDSYDLFELVGRKRGLLISGGEVNHQRCADMLLDEFRGGKIGRITLELP